MTQGTQVLCSGRTILCPIITGIPRGAVEAPTGGGIGEKKIIKKSEIPLLVPLYLWRWISEGFSVSPAQQQLHTLRETTLQCVLATTACFSFRSYYRPLRNSHTFKHEKTKLPQCLHHPRNKTVHTQRSCLLRRLRETIQTKSRRQEKLSPGEAEHRNNSVFPQETCLLPIETTGIMERKYLGIFWWRHLHGCLGIFWWRHSSIHLSGWDVRAAFIRRQDKQ